MVMSSFSLSASRVRGLTAMAVDRVTTVKVNRAYTAMDRVHMVTELRALIGIVGNKVPMSMSILIMETLAAKLVGPHSTQEVVVLGVLVIALQVGSHIIRVVDLMARVPPLAMLMGMVMGRTRTAMEELVQVPMILMMKNR